MIKIRRQMLDYPLFYQRVWLMCAEIPSGQTRSYQWIARKIGQPKAYRAVGQALKHNPFVPVIPCHRVIGKNGYLIGYSGGINKKKQLLEKESKERRK